MNLLAVQGTLKSLFQNHSSKASILQCSAFFIVQLSHPYTCPQFPQFLQVFCHSLIIIFPLYFQMPCSCLENPRDIGAWWAAIYGIAQRTRPKRLSSSSSSIVQSFSVSFASLSDVHPPLSALPLISISSNASHPLAITLNDIQHKFSVTLLESNYGLLFPLRKRPSCLNGTGEALWSASTFTFMIH